MKTMLKYEFKKILQRKISLIAIILLIIAAVGSPFLMPPGQTYITSYEPVANKITEVDRLAAIPYLKKANHEQRGYLTTERFAELIEENNTLRSNPNNTEYYKTEDQEGNVTEGYKLNYKAYMQIQDTAEIREQLANAFTPQAYYTNYNIVDDLTVKDAPQFYQKRSDKIARRLIDDPSSALNFTQKEKDIILSMNAKVETPFYYDYHGGWDALITNVSTGNALFATLVCLVCLASLFAGEYQSGTDSILLTTKKGREKLAGVKVLTAFIFATITYFLFTLLNFIVTATLYGLNGFNCPIQLSAIMSIYNFSMLESYFVCIILGYVAMLSIVGLTIAVSSWFKSPFPTIVLCTAIFVAPMFIQHSATSRLINYLVSIFPLNVMNGIQIIQSYTLFNIFGNYVPPIPIYIVVMLVLIAICIPFAIMGYKKHQVA